VLRKKESELTIVFFMLKTHQLTKSDLTVYGVCTSYSDHVVVPTKNLVHIDFLDNSDFRQVALPV
jgi:hypothetical protein